MHWQHFRQLEELAMPDEREPAWTEEEWEAMWPMPSRPTPIPEPTHPWARTADDEDEWPGWKERDDSFA